MSSNLFQIGPEYIVSFRESRSQRSCWWYFQGGNNANTARKAQAHRFPDRKEAERFVAEAKNKSYGLIFCIEEAP